MKIKEPMKSKLVAALRSGDYRQTRNFLRKDDSVSKTSSFCCLGVMCDLHDDTNWNGTYYQMGDGTHRQRLPLSLVDEYFDGSDTVGLLGAKQREGAYLMFGEPFNDLSAMNDYGLSFKEIADFIEAHC